MNFTGVGISLGSHIEKITYFFRVRSTLGFLGNEGSYEYFRRGILDLFGR